MNEVDEFSEKCRDTGVHRGVIVSAKGFSAGALRKAAFKNIGCFTLSEAQGLDWCRANGIFSRVRRIVGVQFLFEGLDAFPLDARLYEDGVGALDEKKILSIALGIMNSVGPEPLPGEREGQANIASFRDEAPKIYLESTSTGILRPKALILNITYEIDVGFVPLAYHTYEDSGEAKQVGEIASAMIGAGDRLFSLAISGSKDGPKRVTIQPLGAVSSRQRDRRQKKSRTPTK